MRRFAELLVASSVMIGNAALAGAACVDVRQPDALSFTGTLSNQVFPGPPNYEDIKKGDKPERAYILKLDAPICAAGDEFLDSSQAIDTVQLLVDGTAKDSQGV